MPFCLKTRIVNLAMYHPRYRNKYTYINLYTLLLFLIYSYMCLFVYEPPFFVYIRKYTYVIYSLVSQKKTLLYYTYTHTRQTRTQWFNTYLK